MPKAKTPAPPPITAPDYVTVERFRLDERPAPVFKEWWDRQERRFRGERLTRWGKGKAIGNTAIDVLQWRDTYLVEVVSTKALRLLWVETITDLLGLLALMEFQEVTP